MTGFDVSVWNNSDVKFLVVAPNWLGDGIMAMPAVQALREQLAENAELWVGARPNQCGLWKMHRDPDGLIPLPSGVRQLAGCAKDLREHAFTHAVILPNSFRSALAPALARIPCRRGTAEQTGRRWLINDVADLSDRANQHQQWENADLMLPECNLTDLPPPRLSPPEEAARQASDWLQPLDTPRLGLIPGAARGPSKQWEPGRFMAVATRWQQETGGQVLWLGTPADQNLCESCRESAGGINLAGKTTLPVFTAVLAGLDAVVANDSGGMHLAASVGTPVVAIFGLTDPVKTGPLHPSAVVVRAEGPASRAIPRNSPEAREALARISVDEVSERVLAIHRPVE